jgi:uncharacterized delta-60 repeat protein
MKPTSNHCGTGTVGFLRFAAALLAFCALLSSAGAAEPLLDPEFGSGNPPNGPVRAIAVQPDGKILLGGSFSTLGGHLSRGVARLNSDGTVDTSFQLRSGIHAGVRKLLLQPDGKILVGGAFEFFDGTRNPYLVRLNPDGSLDNSFSFPKTNSQGEWKFWDQYRADAQHLGINALALDSAGLIHIFGTGLHPLSSNLRQELSRRLFTNGEFDPEWSLRMSSFSATANEKFGPGMLWQATNVLVLERGTIIRLDARGQRLGSNGGSVMRVPMPVHGPYEVVHVLQSLPDGQVLFGGLKFLSRLRADLSEDPDFRVTLVHSDLDPQDGWAYAAASVHADSIWVGGRFTSVNGTPATNLVELDGRGQPARTVGFPFEKGSAVQALAFDASGLLLVGGSFNSPAGHRFLARWHVGETLVPTETNRPSAAPTIALQPSPTNLTAGAELLLEVSVTGEPRPRLQWYRDELLLPGETNRVLRRWPVTEADQGGYWVAVTNAVGDARSVAATVSIEPTVMAPAGPLAAEFQAQLRYAGYQPLEGVHSLAAAAISAVDAQGRVVVYDPTSGLSRFHADGQPDVSFEDASQTGSHDSTPVPLNRPDGTIIVSRRWAFTEDMPFVLSAVSPEGVGLWQWSAEGSLESMVSAILSSNRTIVAGRLLGKGSFCKVFLADGSPDPSFQATLPERALPYVVLPVENDRVCLAGYTFLSRLNANGTEDPVFATKVSSRLAGSQIDWGSHLPGGDTFLGGYVVLDGTNTSYLVRISPTDELQGLLPQAALVRMRGITAEPGGRVLVWGEFPEINGHKSPGIARLLGDGTVDPAFKSPFTTNTVVASANLLPNGDWAVSGDLELTGVSGHWTWLVLSGDLDQRLHGIRRSDSGITASLLPKAGRKYQVESAGSPEGPEWNPVRELTGANQSVELSFEIDDGQQFFRARQAD